MNPEFERNVWLELTPMRLGVLCIVLVLAFFAAALTDGFASPGWMARSLYLIVVVIWGARNAARSVVGEIHQHTWDSQRLSALGAGTMMWGKLFGSTVLNWTGGAVCLAVIVADTADRAGPLQALSEAVYWIAMGVIAQATSLLASLVAARRRQSHTQFEVFLYHLAGLLAAAAVWLIADPSGVSIGLFPREGTVLWWGQPVPVRAFLLTSLAVFAGWILTGCYRQMRLELKMTNGPYLWLVFLGFLAVYMAGFAAATPGHDIMTVRLFLAAVAMADLAYITVILEPKSRVQLRWLGSELGRGHLNAVFQRLQNWMMAYLLALLLAAALILHIGLQGDGTGQATAATILGFLTRDLGIVVLMNLLARRRGGDWMAIAVLVLLYALMPPIMSGLHYDAGRVLFLPIRIEPVWLSPVVAWLEAAAVWAVAVSKIALAEDKAVG